MKHKLNLILILSVIVSGSIFGQSVKKKPVKNTNTKTEFINSHIYILKSDLTTIKWAAKKVGGEHSGKVKLADGTLRLNGEDIISGNFVVEMGSLTCDDIKNKEYNDKLVDHLKGEDFFNTSSFPHAILDIKKSNKLGNGKYKIFADLNIKGKINPITFDAEFKNEGNMITGKASIVFDRTKFDVKYGSGIIGTAQDKLIYDDINLEIEFTAIKRP